MIIVLRPNPSDKEIDHVVERIKELGFKAHLSKGEHRTIIGVIGDESKVQAEQLQAIPGVEQVLPILKPFKLASREFNKRDTVVMVGKVKIGGGSLGMIAGPCAVESEAVLDDIAGKVKAAGANILRGGAFKPRTSPYTFQGLGEEGLRILKAVGQKHNLPTVTEVMDPRQIPLVQKYADMFQIGARNMQNFDLLKEIGLTRMPVLLKRVGKAKKPVLLKRGMSATLEEWLMAAEYVMAGGNYNVILCERGVRTFSDHSRNTLDLSVIPPVKKLSHLPILVDPSHGTGKRDYVPPMALASLAAGADGLLLEVHPDPDHAQSDGAQTLDFAGFERLLDSLKRLALPLGRAMN